MATRGWRIAIGLAMMVPLFAARGLTAQGDDGAPATAFQGSAGVGLGSLDLAARVSIAAITGARVLSVRGTAHYQPDQPADRLHEIGALYGQRWGSRALSLTAAGGVAGVRAAIRGGSSLDREPILAVGLPLEIEVARAGPSVGISLSAFTNINAERTVSAVTVNLLFRTLAR